MINLAFLIFCSTLSAAPTRITIHNSPPEEVIKSKGLFIIELSAGGIGPSMEIKRKGSRKIYKIYLKDKTEGFYFGLLPPGQYQVTQVNAPYFGLPYKSSFEKDPQWQFSIDAGKTNYLGKLTIDKARKTKQVFISLRNRLAEFMVKHAKRYRSVIQKYPLTSGFSAKDKFQQRLDGE